MRFTAEKSKVCGVYMFSVSLKRGGLNNETNDLLNISGINGIWIYPAYRCS